VILCRRVLISLDHDSRSFSYKFRSEPRRHRHDAGLRRQHQVREHRLDVGDSHHQTTFLRELHLTKIGIGPEQANALLALANESSVESRDGFLFEGVLQKPDIKMRAF